MEVIQPYEEWLVGHSLKNRWTGKNQLLAERLVAVLAKSRTSKDPEMLDLLRQLDEASIGA